MPPTNTSGLHLPAGSTGHGHHTVDVGPEQAGWDYCSLRVLDLPAGAVHSLHTGDSEWIVLPLSGSCTVTVDGKTFELAGRGSVFEGVTDFAYLPRRAAATVTGAVGGRFALAGARCTRSLPARHVPASAVPVELRGAGSCSRQVNNFGAAGVFEADRLMAVEVLTPGGNWSSYPPHKHDEEAPGAESELEEIYYFEIAGPDGGTGPDGGAGPDGGTGSGGFGYQRVSPSGRGRNSDLLAEVRGGDVVLVPDGWHGPSIAAPGHDMYYLNVMAGPGPDRAWLICDHPDHAWVRGTWDGQPVDPRLPLYTAPAPAGDRTAEERPA
ncbi:5-deoxy-glucuronate isomerase [Streptomyces thermolineatus]|uniref:5-deoxy-glucuronate isomerase n=1 Tax=Streptomyces thermolineatus TaxID=44033 RepID=A0ABP6ACD3_9ACTN